MKSRFWLFAALMFVGSVHAIPQYGPGPMSYGGGSPARGPATAPRAANPAVVLRAGMDKLLDFLGSEQAASPEALARFLNTEIAPFFDFEYMARSAGGRMFEQMDERRQRSMVQNVKRTFLTRLAEKLGSYDNQQVRFLPPRAGNDGRTARVSVAVLNPGSYPARLDFRMYRARHQWRVFDVSANGQSAIVHYRRELMRQEQMRQMRQLRQMAPPMRPSGPPPGGYDARPMR